MKLDKAVDCLFGFGVQSVVGLGIEEGGMIKLLVNEAAVLVENPGEAAGHACSEVEAGCAENYGEATGHVLAAVVAHALDNSQCAGVADGEALARAACCKERAACGSVERDVAEDDVQFRLERRSAFAAKNDFAAGEALAYEVVGEALEDELYAGGGKGSEGLAGDAAQLEGELGVGAGSVGVEQREIACKPRAKGAVFVGDERIMRKVFASAVCSQCGFHPRIIDGSTRRGTDVALALPLGFAFDRSGQHGREIERAIVTDLLQQIGASNCRFERGEAVLGEQRLQIARQFFVETHKMLRTSAEFCAKFRALRGDSCWAGIQMALARHVAANGDENCGSHGVLVCAEQRGNEDVARGAKSTVAAQAHATAESVGEQNLLSFRQAKLPGIARVLDAGQRRCSGSAVVAGDHDVVGIRLGDARSYGSDAALGNQFDSDGGLGVYALEVINELREIFDGVDVVMGRRADELHAGLRVAEAGDQLRNFVAGQLATLTGLGALRDFDFNLFGVHQILGGDSEAT